MGQDRVREAVHAALKAAHEQQASSAPIVAADENGAFPAAPVPLVFPVVIDAMMLRDQILRLARTGRRTVLVSAANGGVLRIFCAPHVFQEVEEHRDEWARSRHLGPTKVRAAWEETVLPLLRCVDVPQGLATTEEQRRLDDLAQPHTQYGDPDDVPTATLALLLGAPLMSRDGKPLRAVYGQSREFAADDTSLDRLRERGDAGAAAQYAQSIEIMLGLFGEGLLGGFRAVNSRVSWAPLLLGVVAGGTLIYGATSAEQRRRLGSAVGIAALSLAAVMEELGELQRSAETRYKALAPPRPAEEALADELGDRWLERACLEHLARSPRSDLSAVELGTSLRDTAVSPRSAAVVRAALRRSEAILEPRRGRFQLGHAWSSSIPSGGPRSSDTGVYDRGAPSTSDGHATMQIDDGEDGSS